MEEKYKTIIKCLLLIIVMLVAYYLGSINFLDINRFNIPLTAYSDNDNNCSNLSLYKTSECLKNELNSFFKYNISQLNKDLNISQLKLEGGTCRHYSQWWYDNLIDLGFNATMISFYGEDIGHRITLGYTNNLSDGGYCIFDQKNINCINIKLNMTLYNEIKNEN